MREDFRSRVTQKMIVDCFIEMLGTTSISKITVTEICQRIEINRATFYRHYDNPFDLLESIEGSIVDEMMLLAESSIQRFDKDYLLAVLAFFKDKGKVLQAINSENGDRNFVTRLTQTAYQHLIQQPGFTLSSLTDEQNKWLFYYKGLGCTGIINVWLEDGMRAPVEEVAEFIVECTEGVNKHIAGRG